VVVGKDKKKEKRHVRRLDWDGPNMRASNAPEAEQLIKPPVRKGWEL
jgi:hypothetical protein